MNADDDDDDDEEDARIRLLVPETVIRSLKAFPIGFEFNAKEEEEEHERVLLLLLLLRNNGASLVLVSSILVVFETVDVVGDVVNIVASIVIYVYIIARACVKMNKSEKKKFKKLTFFLFRILHAGVNAYTL